MGVEEALFIVNPASANGATGRAWPAMEAKVRDRLGAYEVVFTEGPGHAALLTREGIVSGAGIVVSVGGDGTLNEVVNGFMSLDGAHPSEVLLGFVPRGTGGDLRRTVPIPRDLERVLDLIQARRFRTMDLGRVRYRDHQGRPAVRYFHNVLSFGLGGEVDERVNRSSKFFGGFVSFMWATLISVLSFEKKSIRIGIEGAEQDVVALNVAVANGQYHGGGMRVAPEARVDDGRFDITVIGDLSVPDVFMSLPLLYNGKIHTHPKVARFEGIRVTAVSDQRVLLDMDGEQPGTLPVEIEMVPSAIRIICDHPL